MELHQLRVFVTVAKHAHVSKAATELHMAQPAVSRMIHELERACGGIALVEKVGRHLRITEAGEALAAHAQTILAEVSAAEATYTVTATNAFGNTTFPVLISVSSNISSAQTGNWSLTTTWNGGVVPTSFDYVTITGNHIVTVNGNYNCASLQVGSGGNSIALLQFSGTNPSLSVTGEVNLGEFRI